MELVLFRLLAVIYGYIIYMREYTVYVHKNLKNEKYYVGMTSQEPKERWHSGWGYLNNTQMWKDIQESDWKTDWVHGILGKFDNKNEALKYEAFLIAMLDSVRNGYNVSTYDSLHYKHSEEHRKRLSESMTGRVFSEEHKKKISESLTGKHPSEETRRKLSEAKTGEKHPFYGKHLSEEHRNKIRENNPSNPVIQYSKSGELIAEYPSTWEASRQTGCDNSNICQCCKGKRKSVGGYIWKYKEGV